MCAFDAVCPAGKGAAKWRAGYGRVAEKSGSSKRFAHQGALPARRGRRRPSCPFLWMARLPFPALMNGAWSIAPPPPRPRFLPAVPQGERRALPAPAQGTKIDCQASATASKKTSKGVRQPSRLRGLWLIRSKTRSNSACDTSRKLQPRG